jgi:GTP:adenosylcobinamide-phosphate guanylyltransferase
VQTAGLEIIRRSTLESGSLTGDRLLPLFLEGPEALDINTPDDWARAEEIAKTWTPS